MESGSTASVSLTVGNGDLAIAFGSGDVPVLATPRLIALCEEATVAAVAGQVPVGSTTVGTRVECDHQRPSRVGETVTARATLVEIDGRRLRFAVSVVNGAGETVATGQVWRAVVERDRFADR